MEAQYAPARVRSASALDAAAIARCHVASWRVGYRGHFPQSVLDSLSEEKRALMWGGFLREPDHGALVAVLTNDVLGFSHLIRSRDSDSSDHTGEIAAIYLAPDHLGQGLGRRLMQASLELARRRGYREVTLWVLDTNTRAQGFYEHMGFAPDGASKREQRIGYAITELRYRLTLRSSEKVS
jgi:GNAT superfamily N-acetyltransferase